MSLGIPTAYPSVPARRLLQLQTRPAPPDAETVTAFRDGQVIARSQRRVEGFTESNKWIGYQGVEPGDLVIHSMDGFAGAIGVSESHGKMSPVVHIYRGTRKVDLRFVAYYLRSLATVGVVEALAKGIRERSTSFDRATLAALSIPVPPADEQLRIVDFLDDQIARIDSIMAARLKQKELLGSLATEVIRNAIQQPHAALAPLSGVVGWIEGPGILAKDFREEGVPILRIAHLRSVPPSLEGCNFVDETEARGRWRRFLTEIGELIVSGSATVGELAVWVTEEIRDAIPYTGLIKLRPRSGLDPGYMRSFFISRVFGEQIDLLKSGIGIQHWGPSHLSQVRIPVPALAIQREVAAEVARVEAHVSAGVDLIDRLLEFLDALKCSLITAAVTGEFDVSTADGSRVPT